MSLKRSSPTATARVRTDAAFAKALRAASAWRNWSRPDLAAHAQVPLGVVHALYRCSPVQPEAVAAVCRCLELSMPSLFDMGPLMKLGRLLRDRREKAGLSRKALGRLAKLSDATVKFTETGVHAPSRATCLRLLSVADLELTWSDLAPFAGPPPEINQSSAESPVFRLDPRVSVEMVREQTLVIDHLCQHQYGLQRSLAGWRRVCWYCGERSSVAVALMEAAQNLTVRHHPACPGPLAESLVGRYPIIRELAQTEQQSRQTLTAQRLHRALRPAAPPRLYGCRAAADLGEHLASVSAGPVGPYRSGVVSVLLWALGLGTCPMGLTAEPFTDSAARSLLASLSENASAAPPSEFLRGVTETVAWILDPQALVPQDLAESVAPAPSLSRPGEP